MSKFYPKIETLVSLDDLLIRLNLLQEEPLKENFEKVYCIELHEDMENFNLVVVDHHGEYLASSGYIADIAIPLAHYHYHNEEGEKPTYKIYNPDTPDLDRYYEISAPEQDLVGDAEAFGWYEAYKQLNSNSTPKLSEILEAYYKVNNPQNIAQTYDNRWKLFCMNTEQKLVTNNGGFVWMPGTDPKNNWGPPYQDFRDRIENFATFWYNKVEALYPAGIYGYTGISLDNWVLSSPQFDDPDVNYIIDKFLSFCKNKFENEQNTTL